MSRVARTGRYGQRPASSAARTFTYAGAAFCAFAAASCGSPLMKLPGGAGAPAADGAEVLTQATAACTIVKSIVVDARVSGRVGGQRIRATLLAGLSAPDSARLEAYAFGQPVLFLVARDNRATLLLPRESSVLEGGRPAEVLEALTGVPLDAAELRTALLGCAEHANAAGARQLGAAWRVVPGNSIDYYFRRASPDAPWRLAAAVYRQSGRPEWRAQYEEFVDGLPRAVRLASVDPDGFDLRLSLADPEINGTLGVDAFELRIPPASRAITLEDLKAAGPLAAGTNDDR